MTNGGGRTADLVAAHYASADIAPRILAALRSVKGAGVPITPETLAPLDQFHGGGLPATKAIASLLEPRAGERLLDIGCGIGGPARWFAASFGCEVAGVDLVEAFCTAAAALTDAARLGDRVRIARASASALPFADASFDRAYSQNVVMNVADKEAVYREVLRVLRKGGRFALSLVCAGPNGDPYYPEPWATTAAASFLATPDETRRSLAAAGFEIASFRDTTADVLASQAKLRERIEAEGPPPLGLHVLLGERMAEFRRNSERSLEEGRLIAVEALARKPA